MSITNDWYLNFTKINVSSIFCVILIEYVSYKSILFCHTLFKIVPHDNLRRSRKMYRSRKYRLFSEKHFLLRAILLFFYFGITKGCHGHSIVTEHACVCIVVLRTEGGSAYLRNVAKHLSENAVSAFRNAHSIESQDNSV